MHNETGLLYSPLSPEAYTRYSEKMGGRFGVGRELAFEGRRPQWNLYWLSDPAVDHFLDDEAAWQSAPAIDFKLFQACCKAAYAQKVGDTQLYSMLTMLTPEKLVEAIKANPHKHLAPFKLRGAAWLDMMQERAQKFRGAVAFVGNVQHVAFGKKVTNAKFETRTPGSATIMPFALRRI